MVNEADLQNAVAIVENLHQDFKKVLHFRTNNGDIIIGTDQSETTTSGSQSLTGTPRVVFGNNDNVVMLANKEFPEFISCAA